MDSTHPNLVYVFADQWRKQACGYTGDPNVRTPRIDAFARESVDLPNAVSGCPVCSPYRASLLTGQYPTTHGMVVNDQWVKSRHVSLAAALNGAGYRTAYIGKWHLDGHGRSKFVPPERRLGFQTWLGYECTHDYNRSPYYTDTPEPKLWEGYDAEAQTRAAVAYLDERRNGSQPFSLFLSWGPPHNPYETAPRRCRDMYRPDHVVLRPNVPRECAAQARRDLAGYYAHCTALDECFGMILDALERHGQAGNTIVVFTSDHGDMLGSQGRWRKQWPYEESIAVPFLLRWPEGLGHAARAMTRPLTTPDIMPTLLGLCGVRIPDTVEGCDFSPAVRGERDVDDGGALLASYCPFHEGRYGNGGRDYRGLRTERHTYVRDHGGPWLLFDNQEDPWQLYNRAADPAYAGLVQDLECRLAAKLKTVNDPFERGWQLLRRFDVRLTDTGDDVHVEP